MGPIHGDVHDNGGFGALTGMDDFSGFFDQLAKDLGDDAYIEADSDGSDGDSEHEDEDAKRPDYFTSYNPDFEPDLFGLGRLFFHHVLPNNAAVRSRLIHYGRSAYGLGKSRTGGFIAATHDDHIHVVHGCSPTRRNECRCASHFGAKPFFARRYYASSMGRAHLKNLWNYLVSGPNRQLIYWTNGGGPSTAYCDLRAPSERQGDTAEKSDLHEECHAGGVWAALFGGAEGDTEHSDASSTRKETLQSIINAIWSEADKEWTSDVLDIMRLPAVIDKYESQLMYLDDRITKQLLIKRSLDFAKQRYWKFNDYRAKLVNANPSFGRNAERMQTRGNSFNAIVNWLHSQFDDDWPHAFLEIIRVFNMDNGKMNSVVFVGPPSCGKTWFITMFKDIARYSGVIRNWAQGDRFTFDGAVDCRMIFHDECSFPIIAPDYIETYKLLTAGQEPVVNIKFKPGTKLKSVPVFIAANEHPLSKCTQQMQYFDNVRWRVYRINPVANFKELTEGKYGNPLALFDVHDYALELIQNI